MSEPKYKEIFDYLSSTESTSEPTGAIVFGRKDPLVARKLVDLSHDGRINWAVISGGTGKDSGDLAMPEAAYLADQAEEYAALTATNLPPILLETQAKNGGENARYSLDVIRRAQLGGRAITAISHATSLRRLAHTLDHAAITNGVDLNRIYREPTDYDFNAANPTDQAEALAEMKRLIEWPNKGWLLPSVANEIPENLVDFVEDKTK